MPVVGSGFIVVVGNEWDECTGKGNRSCVMPRWRLLLYVMREILPSTRPPSTSCAKIIPEVRGQKSERLLMLRVLVLRDLRAKITTDDKGQPRRRALLFFAWRWRRVLRFIFQL